MYRILIAGAGYVGSALAAHYRFKNQNVTALIRTENKKEALEQAGIKAIVADITRPESLEGLPQVHFAVIAVAPAPMRWDCKTATKLEVSLPAAPEKRDPEFYRKTYIEGVGNLLSRMEKNRWPYFVLYLSSTGVFKRLQGDLLGDFL